MMGGTIGVESVAGSGSTFWFQVRLAHAPGEAPSVAPENGRAPDAFLVVASHPLLGDTLVKALVARGARAERASTLESAHGLLLAKPFAAVILIDEGEAFDARTLASQMAAMDRLRQTRVVFVESLRRPLDMSEVRAFRVAARCPKPVWNARLEEIVGETLFDRGPRGDAFAAHSSDPGACVLVVDDSALNAEVTCEILRSSGYKVVAATSGEEALAAVTQTAFDLVLLDRYLPGIDGYETARRIRALEQDRRTRSPRRLPIVALTASATTDDSERARDAGMDGHISKPVERTRLLRVASRHVTASRSLSTAVVPVAAHPVDLVRALARVGGEAAILRRAARDFLELAPDSWNLVQASVKRHDREGVEFAAHRLRGQASTFDAFELVDALRRIERMAEDQRWQDAEGLVGRAQEALEETLRALDRPGRTD